MQKINGNVVIATATDAGYLPAACCQLRSAHLHLPADRNIRLALVLCDVSPADIEEARLFFHDRQMAVDIVIADDIADRICPVSDRWPRSAYLRLYFDAIFGPDIERLIYLDADTRVCAPLQPLIDVALDGAPCGAVHDFIYYVSGNIRRRRQDLFLAADAPYLQSGVMVFDWPATLACGGLERARRFLELHRDRCQEAPDQDALNVAFENKWTPIDPRWNLHEHYLAFRGRLTPWIEHYTTCKPWSRYRPAVWREAAAWYQQELADTAWASFVAPQSPIDRFRARAHHLKFRFSPHLRDACARYAPVLLDVMGKPRERSESVELPWAPRQSRDVEDMAQALVAEAARRSPRLLPPEAAVGRPIGWGQWSLPAAPEDQARADAATSPPVPSTAASGQGSTTGPAVSLLLPVYNGEKYLPQALQSILAQDYPDFELIITDNASTDRTGLLCREIAASDKRVRYVRHAQNLGAAGNFNSGLPFCTGKYIKWCAHDDLISPNYLGACVAALKSAPCAVLAYGITQIIDADGAVISDRCLSPPDYSRSRPARRFYKVMSKSCTDLYLYGDGEVFGLFRADALPQPSPHRPFYGSDRTLLAEMALKGEFAHAPAATFYNRDHAGRGSRLPNPVAREQWIRPDPASGRGLSTIPMLGHLLEIAGRNRRTAPLVETLAYLSLWILMPQRLTRLLVEAVGILSPSLRSRLAKNARALLALMPHRRPEAS